MNRGVRGRGGIWVGEGWAEVEHWQVERAEARRRSVQPGSPTPPLQETFLASQAPRSLGQRWASSAVSHQPTCLCPWGSGFLPQFPQDFR